MRNCLRADEGEVDEEEDEAAEEAAAVGAAAVAVRVKQLYTFLSAQNPLVAPCEV